MAAYLYPNNAEITAVAQDLLPVLTADDPIFEYFPIVDSDATTLIWDQEDNYIGLQQLRGIDGAPQRVKRAGVKRYVAEPGVFGEFTQLDELELTTRARMGTFGNGINIDQLVMGATNQLVTREYARIRQIVWGLVSTGTFAVSVASTGADQAGTAVFTDSYTVQTASGSAWGTPATGTPLADLRALQLLSRGHGVRFDRGAKAFMNRITANKLFANTNAADFGGKRTAGLAGIIGLNDVNYVLTGEDLPNIVINDDGYLDDTSTFVPYIATNKIVVVGRRADGGKIGQYRKTLNVNGDEGAVTGSYLRVLNDPNRVPRVPEVHAGHNGGPVLFFPSGVAVLTVT